MARIIDSRNSDGQIILIGGSLTLPTSNNAITTPIDGSIRWNVSTNLVETYSSGTWAVPGGSGVTSYNGRGGTVVGVSGDVTTALGYTPANIASPTFTGTPAAPTPSTGDNSTKIATTAYVQNQDYISGNQTITLSGAISGSGTTAITTSFTAIADGTVLGNATGSSAAPAATTVTALFDDVFSSTQGDILYRSASNWIALSPGTSGYFLQTQGASANPQWAQATGAVVSFNTRTGAVTLSSGDVTTALGYTPANIASPTFTGTPAAPTPSTGDNSTKIATTAYVQNQDYISGNQTITLSGAVTGSGTNSIIATYASISDSNVLANISGSSNPPSATTATALLDHTFSSTQGTILYRGASSWSALGTGTSGQVLETQGASANPQWTNAVLTFNTRSGAVTLSSGDVTGALGYTPLSGNQSITLSGVVTGSGATAITTSFASIADGTVLANATGSSAAPSATTVTSLLDDTLSSTQGVILYRGASTWSALAPGTAGNVLQTNGASANPTWTPLGLASLPSQVDNTILSNISGGTTTPSANTLTAIIDHGISGTQGTILYRGASTWSALGTGTSGQVLETQGASANPQWTNAVLTFNTRSGAVTLSSGDVTTALTYTPANIASPTFTGTPAAPTPSTGDNSTTLATTAFVKNQNYITGNQTVTLSGVVTGSGATAITTSFANIAGSTLLANATGSPAAPAATTVTALLDNALSSTQGVILYRGASTWAALGTGTAGNVLQTNGASANPSWVPLGLASLPSQADNTILSNISGGSTTPAANTLTAIIDHSISSTQGTILYRGASTWSALGTGTSGQVLETQGVSANPQWTNAVLTFNTRFGAVTLSSGDVTTALTYTPANIASPTFTGTPAAPTPSTGDNSTTLATTAFVKNQNYITGNQTITLSGDITGSGTTSIAATLANSGVSIGTYTKVTVDIKGRVTVGATAATTDLSDVSTTSLANNQVFTYNSGSSKWTNVSPPFYAAGTFVGAPSSGSQTLWFIVFASTVVFPSSLTGSVGICKTAPTGSVTLSILKNGVSQGTINFAGSATTATFTFASPVTFNSGDILEVDAPISIDATFASPAWNLVGIRS